MRKYIILCAIAAYYGKYNDLIKYFNLYVKSGVEEEFCFLTDVDSFLREYGDCVLTRCLMNGCRYNLDFAKKLHENHYKCLDEMVLSEISACYVMNGIIDIEFIKLNNPNSVMYPLEISIENIDKLFDLKLDAIYIACMFINYRVDELPEKYKIIRTKLNNNIMQDTYMDNCNYLEHLIDYRFDDNVDLNTYFILYILDCDEIDILEDFSGIGLERPILNYLNNELPDFEYTNNTFFKYYRCLL